MTKTELAQVSKTTNDWYSADDEPDPSPLPFLCGYYLMVKPLKVKEKVGSLYLPDQVRDDVQQMTNVARVLKLGSDAYKDEGKFPSGPWCKEGDYVVYQKFRGVKIAYKGVPVTIIADDEVLMVVPDPTDVNNNMFNFTKASM